MSGNGSHNDNGGNRYSYSGADCKVFAYRGSNKPIFLESVQTISFSVHEPRGRARALGFKGVKGFSKSVREIAGTMIFTVIEDHPLAPLMTPESGGNYGMGWSIDGTQRGIGNFYGESGYLGSSPNISINRVVTDLNAFNLMLTYTTEVLAKPVNKIDIHPEGNTGVTPDLINPNSSLSREPMQTGYVQSGGDVAFTSLRDENKNLVYDENGNVKPDLSNIIKPPPSYIQRQAENNAYLQTEFHNSYSAKIDKYSEYEVNVAGLVLLGVEIITEGIVTSVNDMITEVQVQFIARDYKEFSLGQYESKYEMNLKMSEASELMRAAYQEHSGWGEFEDGLASYERNYQIDAKLSGAIPVDKVAKFNPNIAFTGTDYNKDTGVYTITSQTNLNPMLMDMPRPESSLTSFPDQPPPHNDIVEPRSKWRGNN